MTELWLFGIIKKRCNLGAELLKDYAVTIGANIRMYREAQKLTQTDLGNLIGITKGAVSQMENGQICPSMDTLFKIADCLDVPAAMLLHDPSYDPEDFEILAELSKILKNKKDNPEYYKAVKKFLKPE